MPPPKVLFVNHSSKPAGAEFVLCDVVKVFNDSAVFLFEDGPLKAILEQQGTTTILAQNTRDMSAIRRDSNLIKVVLPLIGSMLSFARQINTAASNYDCVYANSQKAFVLSALASFINRKPLIWHCHDILSSEHFSKSQIQLDIALANSRCARVFVPSKATADAFVKAGGLKSLVRVVYNGLPPLNNNNNAYSKQQLRSALGLPEGFLYGVFSRLAKWKGQHIAIEALNHLPNAKCVIVGSAQFGEESYGESLHSIAFENNVSERVIFMGHRSDVSTIMQAVDVCCHPSIAPEPFSLAILEAMRAGLPVAGSNTGGIPEVVTPGLTGFLAEPGSALSMANILKTLMNEPNLVQTMSENAQSLISSSFTLAKMQHDVLCYLSEIDDS
jgi:glycosyltransferase involved in cell wall biosynthesis